MTDNVFLATMASALRGLARTGELQGMAAATELERLAARCDDERARSASPVSGPEVEAVRLCVCGHAFRLHSSVSCWGYGADHRLCSCPGWPGADAPLGPRADRARALCLLDGGVPG